MEPEAQADGDRMRRARNCDGNTPPEELKTLCFEWAPELKQCPNAVITEAAKTYLEIWKEWRVFDVLPEPGTLAEQPAHIFQGIRVCELLRIEQEMKDLEKAKREAERGGKG